MLMRPILIKMTRKKSEFKDNRWLFLNGFSNSLQLIVLIKINLGSCTFPEMAWKLPFSVVCAYIVIEYMSCSNYLREVST